MGINTNGKKRGAKKPLFLFKVKHEKEIATNCVNF